MNVIDAVRSGTIPASRIRNFCMLAHVDHGKTTLSDYLLSANGMLSEALAGEVRFLDSRPDEQERLITMKASSVALQHNYKGEPYLCNLVDSPGHIDFSCEVSTAMRVCDGGLIIVDIVDGATMQTHLMLRHGLLEGLSMCLVINKLDVAIVTQGLSPEEVYAKVSEIVTSCNVALAAVVASLNISSGGDAQTDRKSILHGAIPEDEVWFSPAKGNVIFASAIDGWAFSLAHFANLYSKKLPFSKEALMEALWGEHFIVGKELSKKPKKEGQPPLFVTHVLQPIHTLYNTFTEEPFDPEAVNTLATKMGLPRKLWDIAREPRLKLKQLLSHWMPLATNLLDMVTEKLDSPPSSNQRRLPSLLPTLHQAQKSVRDHLWRCSNDADAPTVCFVAKLIDTHNVAGHSKYTEQGDTKGFEDIFVAFGRVYCGRVQKGQKIFVHSNQTKVELQLGSIYVLQGQGLVEVDDLPAGCLFAASGVSSAIVKSATLCSDSSLPPFKPLSLLTSSIVKQTVLPKDPATLPQLLKALKYLNQVDPQLELAVLPTGDHVICCAGEVHAERCVVDLQETFLPDVEFDLSPPIVTFRETIVAPSLRQRSVTVKTVNGHYSITLHALPMPEEATEFLSKDETNTISSDYERELLHILRHKCEQKKKWTDILQNGIWAVGPRKFSYSGCILVNGMSATLDDIHEASGSPMISAKASPVPAGAPAPAGEENQDAQKGEEEEGATHIEGTEVAEKAASVRSDESNSAYTARLIHEFSDAILSGFQIGVQAGSMAEEPLFGIAFVVTAMEFHRGGGVTTKGMDPENAEFASSASLPGQIIYAVSSAIRQAMEQHGRRLVEPVYSCVVQSSGATQGKIYGLLSRRRAEILDEVLHEGSDIFHILCNMPAVESFGLLSELRDSTHGAATAQLRMSHWNIVDADPYFKPTSKEEIEELGAKVAAQNIGESLLERVRRRKGLYRGNTGDPEKQKFSVRGS